MKIYLVQTIGIAPQLVELQETESGCFFVVLFRDVCAAEQFLIDYYSHTANRIKQQTPTLIFRLSLSLDYEMFASIKNYIREKLNVFFFICHDLK